ncbi:hypothetical protein [Sphingomonas sp. Leaf4]|uniref:hypothetical protein n=1 Tax=Sphingomonas sp. Leaf4 TaxID=2876553 RepID=UPI001E3CAC31|nr:hypothetical protein [Sphingomonas sp. Leaf4]
MQEQNLFKHSIRMLFTLTGLTMAVKISTIFAGLVVYYIAGADITSVDGARRTPGPALLIAALLVSPVIETALVYISTTLFRRLLQSSLPAAVVAAGILAMMHGIRTESLTYFPGFLMFSLFINYHVDRKLYAFTMVTMSHLLVNISSLMI